MHRTQSITRMGRFAAAIQCVIAWNCCCLPLAAQLFPVNPSLPLATGAFIQLHAGFASNTPAWWQTELGSMKSIGMDTVVINYVAYDKFYFYPTSVPGGMPFAVDSIENILDAADQHGMDVYLGLHLDPDQFSTSTFDLQANLAQGQAELTELWSRYGNHPSLAGWYMPQEFSDYMVFNQPQLRNDIITYTSTVTNQAHVSSGLPMMISPYFGQNPNAAAYGNWWNSTGLPQTGVDIVAMQDGVGTHRTTIAESRTVFQALAPVMANHGVVFWANNESFNQIHGWPVDSQPWAAQPTGIGTFAAQIESTNPFVEKSITFEFSHYMSPQGTLATNALYQDYKAYFESVVLAPRPIEIASYRYENPATTWVHNLAPDPNNALLIDGNTGSLSGGASGAFANGTWAGFGDNSAAGGPQPGVVFDLGGEFLVDAVELFYMVAASPSILRLSRFLASRMQSSLRQVSMERLLSKQLRVTILCRGLPTCPTMPSRYVRSFSNWAARRHRTLPSMCAPQTRGSLSANYWLSRRICPAIMTAMESSRWLITTYGGLHSVRPNSQPMATAMAS